MTIRAAPAAKYNRQRRIAINLSNKKKTVFIAFHPSSRDDARMIGSNMPPGIDPCEKTHRGVNHGSQTPLRFGCSAQRLRL